MATVALSGASGFVGGALGAALRSHGHTVRPLVRPGSDPGPDGIPYEPGAELDPEALGGCDAVVHLAAENIASGRWTAARKARLRESRVATTLTLANAIAALAPRAPRLVSASAVGFYGDAGDTPVDEDAPAGEGFLASICVDWEAATQPAVEAGASVVQARLGVVLAPDGGALARMLPAFRMGVAGKLGDGRQWMSWVALRDVVRALEFLALGSTLEGPVNVCAPGPVTNAQFTEALARVLRRPAVIPLPGPLAKLALGEMAKEALLSGQRVRPARLLAAGFHYDDPDLATCLRDYLASTSAVFEGR